MSALKKSWISATEQEVWARVKTFTFYMVNCMHLWAINSHEDDQGPQREWVPRLDDEELLTSHVLLHYSSGTISRLFLVMYSGWMLKPLSTSRGYVPVHANHLRRNQWPQGLLTPFDAAFPKGLKHLKCRDLKIHRDLKAPPITQLLENQFHFRSQVITWRCQVQLPFSEQLVKSTLHVLFMALTLWKILCQYTLKMKPL